MRRPSAYLLLLLVPLGAAACSSDDSGSDDPTETTAGTEVASDDSGVDDPAGTEVAAGDVEAYCDAVRTGADLYEQYKDVEDPPQDAIDEFLDAFATAGETAPAELGAAYSAVLNEGGDADAQATIDEFNESECGVGPIELPTTTG